MSDLIIIIIIIIIIITIIIIIIIIIIIMIIIIITFKEIMPGPGFEPGLLRPQRRVLTTRRSRRAIEEANGRIRDF